MVQMIGQEGKEIHIIAITESKPKNYKSSVNYYEYSLPGYRIYHNYDKQLSHRGVIVYVRQTLDVTEVDCGDDFSENVWIKLRTSSSSDLVFVCMYRSPSSSVQNNEKLLQIIDKICQKVRDCDKVLIVGDFNLPEINWCTELVENGSDYSDRFLKKVQDNFLTQHVDRSTRARPGQKSNILDLIFTASDEKLDDINYRSPLGKSDHSVIFFSLNASVEVKSSIWEKLLFDKGDYESMREELRDMNWESELSKLGIETVEACWEYFKQIYENLVIKYVPKRKIGNTDCKAKNGTVKKAGYINAGARKLIKRKHRLWRRYLETEDIQIFEKFKKVRNKAKTKLRDLANANLRNIVKNIKRNPKQFWAFVNRKSKVKPDIPDLEISVENGNVKLTTDVTERATALSKQFASVFSGVTPAGGALLDNDQEQEKNCEIQFSAAQVREKLQMLNPSKSPGPDGIHPRILKELADEFSGLLCFLFNKSLEDGVLPNDWKLADISALYKGGDKKKPVNYRPVSLTSVVCKVMEGLIRQEMDCYLESKNLLNNNQYGFKKGRSTVLQLLKVLDEITLQIDRGEQIDMIYTDFSKAFDTVVHDKLLLKLKEYGFNKHLINWIKHFLLNRKQRVKIKGSYSEWEQVLSGVPQGSVLGPLLFILFIDDIVQAFNSFVYLYADDMKLFGVIRSSDDVLRLQGDLDGLWDWVSRWSLRLNVSKCGAMSFGRMIVHGSAYYIGEGTDRQMLTKLSKERDLGVIIDEDLSFDIHISEMVKRANQMLGIIKRNFKGLDRNSLLAIYKSMVRSKLEYAHSVWNPHKQKHIKMIERVQRRATKLMPGLRDLSYTERLKCLKLPTLAFRRIRGDMIEVYKIMHGVYDERACPGLQRSGYCKTRGHDYKLFKVFANKTVRQHFFTHRVVNVWNSLPEELVHAQSLNGFKNRLDSFWSDKELHYNYRANILE